MVEKKEENTIIPLVNSIFILLSFFFFVPRMIKYSKQRSKFQPPRILRSNEFYITIPPSLFVHSRRAYYISRCSNELFSRIELNDSGNVTSCKAWTNRDSDAVH